MGGGGLTWEESQAVSRPSSGIEVDGLGRKGHSTASLSLPYSSQGLALRKQGPSLLSWEVTGDNAPEFRSMRHSDLDMGKADLGAELIFPGESKSSSSPMK